MSRRGLRVFALVGAFSLLPSLSAAQSKPSTKDAEEAPMCEDTLEVFTPFVAGVASGNVPEAMDALAVVLKDPEMEGCHGQAYIRLGGLLEKEGLPYAGALAWSQGMQMDPDATSAEVVTAFLALEERHGDQALLERTFAENIGYKADKETRSHMAYLGARGSYAQGNYSTALGILSLVQKDSPDMGKGMALKGVILTQQGRYNDAMAALLTAQALVGDDTEMLDTVNLNLGRTYYAAGNYPKAIEYYAKVSRESHWWPEAQFERAWAHFRIQDINGALGILHTHVTPFYDDWYFPEAQLLRTYSLFLICKFPEASAQIEEFQTTWTPVRDELQSTISAMDANAVFTDARSFVETGESELSEMALRDVPYDKSFIEATESVDVAKAELGLLASKSGNWVDMASGMVQTRHDELIEQHGGRIKSQVQNRAGELTSMLTDTEIAKLDMLRLETKLYEQASMTGQIPDAEKKVKRSERVRKGYVSWPYEGEMWADEVGYYRVNATPECPPGLMAGGKK